MADQPLLSARQHPLISRRSAVAGAIASIAGIATIRAQDATPDLATPQASPQASPVASPVSTATPIPSPTPVPVYPMAIIRDQRPEWAGTPQPGGDLRLQARAEGLGVASPTAMQQDFGVMMSYLDPLIWVDEVSLEPRPWLATRWTWSSDKLSLAITLRDDVSWHDGSPLTADDVQFSLLCHRDDLDSVSWFMLAVVSDVTVQDETHLTVHFDEPDGTFPYNAANLPVFQRAQWEAFWLSKPLGERTLTGADVAAAAVQGTGPWALESLDDDGARLRRNADHFAAVPLAETLAFTTHDTPFDAWKDEDLDLIWPFAGNEVEGNLQRKSSLVVADGTQSFFAAFNFGNPTRLDPGWMASAGLREALNLVVNREAYAKSIFGGFIDVERAGFMTQPWAIDATVKNPKRDVAAARKLLEDNGWADWDGDGVLDSPSGDRGALVCIVRDDADANLLAILETLDADFQEIGFTLEIQRLAANDFALRWTTGFDYDLIALSLNQYAAFNEFDLVGSAWSIRRNTAGWNPGGYWNPDVDQALQNYLLAVEQSDMKRELSVVQRKTNDDLFALWLGFPQQLVLVQPDISGFQPNKMWQSWSTWSLWRGDEASIVTPTPSPIAATPILGTPSATPIAGTPEATPVIDEATPMASPAASPAATPES